MSGAFLDQIDMALLALKADVGLNVVLNKPGKLQPTSLLDYLNNFPANGVAERLFKERSSGQ